jgi:galactokinase
MENQEHGRIADIPEIPDLIQQAKDAFKDRFGRNARFCGIAPGRVNLIGEHTGKT